MLDLSDMEKAIHADCGVSRRLFLAYGASLAAVPLLGERSTARAQGRPPLSAVARDTGFAPAIVARMILDGRIAERGVLPPERCVPAAGLLSALAARGMRARRRISRPR